MNTQIRHTLALLALLLPATLCQAASFSANLSGANEAPPNASPGSGMVQLSFDPMAHMLGIDVTFGGLLAPSTAAHIHCCTALPGTGTAGVATQTPSFNGFPLGVTAGTYNVAFNTALDSTWSSAFLAAHGGAAGAEAAFGAGLLDGRAYFNIHSMAYPGGEIRGFLAPVPEPSPMAMLGAGLLGLLGWRLRRTAR
ncbi:CHRD domain-containing protein [Janthinobacterium fluminis]|uniref:CHRD domain-containing protein n=1 Tax=Janthinobacterium fluminis TaxID=2987524 RepID=A0ABT5K1I5_9BURK|nr:CHRD domain-containing protein [Janthinobacterium fluminis]MDC8758535.1 CHRD domain-containing protein [Janthinobacterium fluminis]